MKKIIETLLSNGFKESKNPCSDDVEKYWLPIEDKLYYEVTPDDIKHSLAFGSPNGTALDEESLLRNIELGLQEKLPGFKFK